jgi:ribosomal protein S18 acetylase RimI-like enzyme
MNIRPVVLPNDLDVMETLILGGFEYPDHPEWSIQADEKEGRVDRLRGMKRSWPLIRIMRFFSPVLRDGMLGFIAEEDGRPVGLMNYARNNKEPEWFLFNAAILPEYRRRGIAKQMMDAMLDDLRRRKARALFLNIISQNVPSMQLCQGAGFEVYSSSFEMDLEAGLAIAEPVLPPGWTVTPRSRFDWRTEFELAKKITPENVARYEPLVESRFRVPFVRPIMGPIFERTGGNRSRRFTLRAPNGEVAGMSGLWYRVNPGGVNGIWMLHNTAYPEAAYFLAAHAFATVQRLSPGRRVEFDVESWEPALIEATEALGAKKRFTFNHLGLKLQ